LVSFWRASSDQVGNSELSRRRWTGYADKQMAFDATLGTACLPAWLQRLPAVSMALWR